jgi:fatty-acid peroxygenase
LPVRQISLLIGPALIFGIISGVTGKGGGDPSKTHRCPGEGITVEIIKASLNFIVNSIEFEVPEQDLSYSMARIPTLPRSGFILNNVKRNRL